MKIFVYIKFDAKNIILSSKIRRLLKLVRKTTNLYVIMFREKPLKLYSFSMDNVTMKHG